MKTENHTTFIGARATKVIYNRYENDEMSCHITESELKRELSLIFLRRSLRYMPHENSKIVRIRKFRSSDRC